MISATDSIGIVNYRVVTKEKEDAPNLPRSTPRNFVDAILKSICLQRERDRGGLFMLGAVEGHEEAEDMQRPAEEEDEHEHMMAWDDLSGEELDSRKVAKARKEELEYYRSMGSLIHPKTRSAPGVKVHEQNVGEDWAQDMAYEEGIVEEPEDLRASDLINRRSKGLSQKSVGAISELLDAVGVKTCKSIIARANYLCPERPDVCYIVKELARRMSSPDVEDWKHLCHFARYLAGRPRLRIWFYFQSDPGVVSTYTDSDWAGCMATRRSMSGGVMMYGRHVLKCWSRTHATLALSSAAAELAAALKGSCECMCIMSMLRDFVKTCNGVMLGDASAALGVIRRQGVGRMKHIDVNMRWVRQKAAERTLDFQKFPGASNPADRVTKFVSKERIDYYMGLMNCGYPTDVSKIRYTINGLDGFEGRAHGDGYRAEKIDQNIFDKLNEVDGGIGFLGAHGCSKEVASELLTLAQACGRPGAKIWSRCDLKSATYRTTGKCGPNWDQVLARMSVQMRPQKIIESNMVSNINRAAEHGRISDGKCDLVTYLLYVDDRWKFAAFEPNLYDSMYSRTTTTIPGRR